MDLPNAATEITDFEIFIHDHLSHECKQTTSELYNRKTNLIDNLPQFLDRLSDLVYKSNRFLDYYRFQINKFEKHFQKKYAT